MPGSSTSPTRRAWSPRRWRHPDGGGLGVPGGRHLRLPGRADAPGGLRARGRPGRATFDYAGLNHLGWLRRVEVDGRDLLPGLLTDDAALLSIEEGACSGPDWLRTLGAVPNEYLWYWYYTAEAVAAAQQAGQTRGEYLSEQQARFYADAAAAEPAAALAAWERTRHDREATYMAGSHGSAEGGPAGRAAADLDGGGYDRMALELMRAIAYDEPATMVLNVAAPGRRLPWPGAGRRRGGRGPVRGRRGGPATAPAGAARRPPAGAGAVGQGGRDHDHRGRPHRLAAAGAACAGHPPAGRLRDLRPRHPRGPAGGRPGAARGVVRARRSHAGRRTGGYRRPAGWTGGRRAISGERASDRTPAASKASRVAATRSGATAAVRSSSTVASSPAPTASRAVARTQ